jgi:hypothetical protein
VDDSQLGHVSQILREYGIELAERNSASGTPTVWIDGEAWRPTLQELRDLAKR